MRLPIISLTLVSFVISWIGTLLMKRIAPRFNFVDKPGHRKIHHVPKPLGGGVAIFLGIALPLIAGILFAHFYPEARLHAPVQDAREKLIAALIGGTRPDTPLAFGVWICLLLMHRV